MCVCVCVCVRLFAWMSVCVCLCVTAWVGWGIADIVNKLLSILCCILLYKTRSMNKDRLIDLQTTQLANPSTCYPLSQPRGIML